MSDTPRWAQEAVGSLFANEQDLEIVGYGQVGPSVRELVRVIRASGLSTASSCDGHAVGEGSHAIPWVVIHLREEEGARLARLARLVAEWNALALAEWWLCPRMVRREDGSLGSFLFLRPQEDNDECDAEILERLRREAQGLAEYIAGAPAG